MNKSKNLVKTITEVIGMNKNKKIAAAFTLIFTAAATMAGAYALGNFTTKDSSGYVDLSEVDENKTAKNEEETQETEGVQTAQAEESTDHEFGMDNVMDATDEYLEESTKTARAETTEETTTDKETKAQTPSEESTAKEEETETDTAEVMSASAVNESVPVELNFQPEDKLIWPVAGEVIMDYSMDSTTYFQTLDQYKYNPALIIGCDVGTNVEAAADGKVLSVENLDETGTTVTVDLGNGYQAVYGQLKDVTCQAGDFCKAGEVLGKVSEPSGYYSIEGSNLFLKLEKDGEPVDPMSFLN